MAAVAGVATVVAVPARAPSGTHPPAPGPELLGANHEQGYSSDEEHERRCEQENGRRKCGRCKYKRLAAKWKEATGHSGPEGKWGAVCSSHFEFTLTEGATEVMVTLAQEDCKYLRSLTLPLESLWMEVSDIGSEPLVCECQKS